MHGSNIKGIIGPTDFASVMMLPSKRPIEEPAKL